MFVVHLRDGKTLKESEGTNWKEVPTREITSLQLFEKDRKYTIAVKGSNVKLLQLKRRNLDVFTGQDTLVERVIGFIIQENGVDKYAVKMEVDEKSGDPKVTLEVYDEKGKKGRKWRML